MARVSSSGSTVASLWNFGCGTPWSGGSSVRFSTSGSTTTSTCRAFIGRGADTTLPRCRIVYTGDQARVSLVVQAIQDKVADPTAMRALGFCVSVAHAEFMAREFVRRGLPAVAVSADTNADDRDAALRDLRNGKSTSSSALTSSTRVSTFLRSTPCCSCDRRRARWSFCSSSGAACDEQRARTA